MKGNVLGQGGSKLEGDNTAIASSVSGTTLKLTPPKGCFDGVAGNNVTITDADFISANIKNGINIFGITGTLSSAVIVTGTHTNPFSMAAYTTEQITINFSDMGDTNYSFHILIGTTGGYGVAGFSSDGLKLVAATGFSSSNVRTFTPVSRTKSSVTLSVYNNTGSTYYPNFSYTITKIQ